MPATELTPTDPTAFPLHQQQSTSNSSRNNLTQANLFDTSNAMIRHSSLEANSHPGLSFFCKNDNTIKYQQQPQEPQTATFEKQTTPLVISRLNISHRKPAKNGFTDLDDETPPTCPPSPPSPPIQPSIKHAGFFNFASAFKPGFGSVGMLRGKQKLDDARVNRKIEDLEIEKSSLLTLNQTLESVVKQQSTTIHDLQTKLAAIEGPLKPGLDKTLNVKGVMSTSSVESDDYSEMMEDEDAAYERIRNMLLQLIEQAQSAVSEQQQKHQIRAISTQQQGITRKNQRPRSVDMSRRQSVDGNNIRSRRDSVTSQHSLYSATATTSPANKRRSLQVATPIPNHRRLQRSVSRSSSPAILISDDRCPSPTPSVRSNTKKRIKEQQPTARKWQN